MVDFNNDNKKIDTALHGLAEQVAGKAAASTVNSLAAAVNTKAEQSALAAETAAREAADAALQGGITALTPRAGAQLLKTFELTETCSEFTVPLQDIAWDQWKAVHILVDITSTSSLQVQIMIDSNTISYVDGNDQADRDTHSNLGHVIFYPMFDGRKKAEFIVLHEGRLGLTGRQYRDFNALNIKCSTKDIKALPGTEITVWGEK